jgi:uncharacterized membrane protein YhiD involved in acid resistance
MLDYLTLQGSTENPTFITILFTILLAFLLSSLIAFTYQKTTQQVMTPVEYLQSIILVSIVAATVMQAIGDSLARGLGMLGALAIIRFRTTLRTPRNMVFTFAALATGIACGVYGYVIGIVGTIGFCAISFILKFSPLRSSPFLIGTLKFELPKSSDELTKVETILKQFCKKHSKVRYQFNQPKLKESAPEIIEKLIAYEYRVKLKTESDGTNLDTALSKLNTLQSMKLNFENLRENV